MRDDSARWTAFNPVPDVISANGIALAPVTVQQQMLISGTDVLGAPLLPLASWPDIVTAPSYALALRRGRIVLIDGPAMRDGWNEDTQHAVSDATDAFAVLGLVGANAFAVLKRGAELRLDQPSRSVARLLFGIEVLLYRHATPDGFRLHVASGQSEALIGNLKAAMRAL